MDFLCHVDCPYLHFTVTFDQTKPLQRVKLGTVKSTQVRWVFEKNDRPEDKIYKPWNFNVQIVNVAWYLSHAALCNIPHISRVIIIQGETQVLVIRFTEVKMRKSTFDRIIWIRTRMAILFIFPQMCRFVALDTHARRGVCEWPWPPCVCFAPVNTASPTLNPLSELGVLWMVRTCW